jgi:hypothetical protein
MEPTRQVTSAGLYCRAGEGLCHRPGNGTTNHHGGLNCHGVFILVLWPMVEDDCGAFRMRALVRTTSARGSAMRARKGDRFPHCGFALIRKAPEGWRAPQRACCLGTWRRCFHAARAESQSGVEPRAVQRLAPCSTGLRKGWSRVSKCGLQHVSHHLQ